MYVCINQQKKGETTMKKFKKLLCLVLIFVLACSIPAQAAAKKVTAAKFEQSKKDYPAVKTGKYSVIVNSSIDGEAGVVQFTAKKAGTYKFTIKKDKNSTMIVPSVSLSKNQLLSQDAFYGMQEKPEKYKLKKGDTVYIGIVMVEFGMLYDDKATLVIKKVK